MRSRIAAFVSVFVTIVVAPGLLVGCSFISSLRHRETVPNVERRVDDALREGATRAEIVAWLDTQGIEHSFLEERVCLGDSTHSTVGEYSGVVRGIIRNTDRSLFVRGNIELRFVLGKDGRLARREVKWVGTGP